MAHPSDPKTPSTPKPASRARPKPVAVAKMPAAADAADDPSQGGLVVTTAGPALRKKALLERVQKATKAKKSDVKTIVEATLALLGEALAKGEELILPPFGKAKVNRQKDVAGGEVLIIRLRRGGAKGKSAAEPLADDDE